jgi:two-component system, OmpR family, response regulator
MNAPLKVLCVDDHKDTANTTAMLLRAAGFDVRACYGAIEALAEAEQFRPDVCLIDLALPDLPGEELATRLCQREGPPPRLIALTGSWDIGAQHRTHNAGFEQHLVKPVNPERLVEAVRGVAPAEPAPG